jgi:hypothetical protein
MDTLVYSRLEGLLEADSECSAVSREVAKSQTNNRRHLANIRDTVAR